MRVAVPFTVTSPLPDNLGHIPISSEVDFSSLIASAGLTGVLNPNTIVILDVSSGTPVPHGRTEDFAYSDCGRLEWVIADGAHKEYEIHFSVVAERPPLLPQEYTPMVGVGDLIRYNAGVPRPITLGYSMKLVDITGYGQRDLVGCWNYYHRPGSPISGVVCYPRDTDAADFTFGDMVRLRYRESGGTDLHHFAGVYQEVEFADFTGNGLVDIVFTVANTGEATFYLNTGERDEAGWPVYVKDISINIPKQQNGGICAVDLDEDGVLDLVVNGAWIRNTNSDGWPFQAAEAVDLNLGRCATFLDLNGDGRLDAIYLEGKGCEQMMMRASRGTGVEFENREPLGLSLETITQITTADDGHRVGILVQHNMYQNISFFSVEAHRNGEPVWTDHGRAESLSAPLQCSDQAWPCVCDWDDDGVADLLIGGGYGWPRVVINDGTSARPVYRESVRILSGGAPIRVLRDEILYSDHWHNMGYPYPVLVDWDGDGVKDLMLPNETNRIIWYRNTGSNKEPVFGPAQYLAVEGFVDSADKRKAVGQLALDKSLENHPYPWDETSPFWWRTGAAFADWNNDGLMDMITHDNTRKAALFVQTRLADGSLRLEKHGQLRLEDGRLIDDSIVGREKHWTESFRPVDWDGNGLLDLVYSNAGTGKIFLLRNVGTKEEPLFAAPREFTCYGKPIGFTIHGPNAWPADMNGDGKPDLLGCVEWSVYPFFCHAALEMDRHPDWVLGQVRVEAG
jgi:hypothetical protein